MSRHISIRTRLALALGLLALGMPAAAQKATTGAFIDAIGVNAHIAYSDSDYNKLGQVIEALRYLGIRDIRTSAPSARTPNQANLTRLADLGYRFCFLTQPSDPLPIKIAALAAFERRRPGAIAAIEGINEINNNPRLTYQGMTGNPAAIAFQNDLFAAVRAEPLLSRIPVYNLTGPPLFAAADASNYHPYPKQGAQPFAALQREFSAQQAKLPGKPSVITEAGYHTAVGPIRGWEGVDGPTQARLTLTLLFEAMNLGVRHIYLYQLFDAYGDPTGVSMEKHFGLFDHALRPKPAATAIHNLVLALRPTRGPERSAGGREGPGAAAATVRSTDPEVMSLELGGADGSRALLLYRRTRLWDPATHQPVTPAPTTATVSAPGYTRFERYEPMKSAAPVGGGRLAGAAAVTLGADPVLLMLRRNTT